jgi:hypothetical protein
VVFLSPFRKNLLTSLFTTVFLINILSTFPISWPLTVMVLDLIVPVPVTSSLTLSALSLFVLLF